MSIQITLIGLGRIGTSLGLALKRKAEVANLKIVGHDRDLQFAKTAQAKGAIDVAEWNLPAACEKADVVYVCVPFSEMQTALAEIAPHLKVGCVLTDTAPLKSPVLAWAAKIIPADRYYIGGVPIPNPAFLHEGATGLEAARADLFDSGLWALVPDVEASPEALKLIGDLARLMGATPFFVGALELDALMAGTHTLPALSAATLIQVVAASPDWVDGRKLADRTFATSTAAVSFSSPGAIRAAALINSANVLRLLDAQLVQLTALRKAIAENDAATLDGFLIEAAIAREAWLIQSKAANWEAAELPQKEMPTTASMFKQMIGLGRWGESKKDKK